MKICKLFVSVMLMSMVAFWSSCSDGEDVFFYTFKDIEYSLAAGDGDGMTEYETPWEECYSIVNVSETSEAEAVANDLYKGYHEHYYFECADASLFNPTSGYVHVTLPEALTSGGQIVFDEKKGEYSLDKVEVLRSYEGKMFKIPAKPKFVLERKVMMKKLTLTYTATFQRHPAGKDHVVTGKFVRHIPIGVALMENYVPVQ